MVVCVRSMTVVCSSVKDTVINNSELSPKFFTIPEQRHPGGGFSHPSRNTCSRESTTTKNNNTTLTTHSFMPHSTNTDIRYKQPIYRDILHPKGHQSPVRRVRDCVPSFRFPGSERSQGWL